jgi:ankyrin repeat protein
MAGLDRAEALFKAVKDGDVDKVERLLDQDCGLLEARDEDDYNMTLLSVAAEQGRMEVVRLLLDRGAELEARDYEEETALFRAVAYGHEEIVDMLLSRGADARTQKEYAATPLQAASSEGNLGVVRLLVQHLRGQGLNDVNMRGRTALWLACRNGHTELGRVLLLAGADHTIPGAILEEEDEDDSKITPLLAAETQDHKDIATLLKVNATTACGSRTTYRS